MKQFNEGDVVYFVSSSIFIKKATVIRNAGGFCTIRFEDGNCGTSGTRVRGELRNKIDLYLNHELLK